MISIREMGKCMYYALVDVGWTRFLCTWVILGDGCS